MKKSDVVQMIFHNKREKEPVNEKGWAFAPTNIALCKYWGKRDSELNLPMTSSLSIALPNKGALTNLSVRNGEDDLIILNGEELALDSGFVIRIKDYLDLFRPKNSWRLQVEIKMNIPAAAGLASSACGFASLISALNALFDFKLTQRELSVLARLGSGSASRSLWTGFVEWAAGVQSDGMDSYAQPLGFEWRDLQVGILAFTHAEKSVSSRSAMQRSVESSVLYGNWPKKVALDMVILKQALQEKNFSLLGSTSESNALTMHATMLSSWPPVCYFLPETIAAMQQIWNLRREGLGLYFTEDAGPNLKLLFLEKDKEQIKEQFPQVEMVRLFE